jgi:MFS family permease
LSVRAALWSAFLFRAAQSAVGVIISLVLAGVTPDRAITAATVGILLSTNFAVELLAAPTFGALSDRFGRKPFIVLGPLLGFLASQIYPATSSLAPLFLARGLEGTAAGSLTPSSLGFLSDATTATVEKRGRTMAFFEIATLLGIGGGYALGGVLYQATGPNAFRVASALYLLSAVAAWRWLPQTRLTARAARPSLAAYVKAATQPGIVRLAPAWLAVTAVLGVWFANTVYQLSGPSRPDQALTGGFSGNAVSAILTAFVVALITGTYIWSRLFARFDRKTTMMLVALGGMLIVCLDLLIVNHRDGASPLWLALLLPLLAWGWVPRAASPRPPWLTWPT